MAILKSPHYQGLSIYVGENPIPGSFYSGKPGENLSVIANKAYKSGTITPVLRINKSEWNIANCAYRKKSANCYSEHVDATLARSQSGWGDGAWIAICQVDIQDWAKQLGLRMPVIWIPTVAGDDPEDLVPRIDEKDVILPKDEGAPGPDVVPNFGDGTPVPDDSTPAPGGDDSVPNDGGDDDLIPGGDDKRRPRRKKSLWPWLLVGGVLLAGGIYFVAKKKKKK